MDKVDSRKPLKYGAVVHYCNDVRFIETVLLNVEKLLASDLIDEVLIWDDGSDFGKEFPSALLQSEPRLRLERHPRNLGIYAARLRAIASIQSEYIWMIDSDDSIIKVPEILPGSDIYCFDFLGTHLSGNLMSKYECGVASSPRSDILRDRVSCVIWNKIVKKSLVADLVDHRFRNGDDLYIMLHALSGASGVQHIRIPIINYLIRPDSLSRASRSGRLYDLAHVIKRLRVESKVTWIDSWFLWWNYIIRNFIRSVVRQGNPIGNESLDLLRSLKCLF